MQFDIGRIDDRHIVDAVAFHVGGDIVSATNDEARNPAWLPGKADARLPVTDTRIGVVVGSDLWRSGEEGEVAVVLVILVAAGGSEFVAKTEVEGQAGRNRPIVLHEASEQAVAK